MNVIFFLRQIIYFSCMNHSVTADHWTLINVIIQLSEALCFLSRFHLQTPLLAVLEALSGRQTKVGLSGMQRGVQELRSTETSLGSCHIWGLAKAILSFHWFNFSRRDHSLLPFIHHWQVPVGYPCTRHQPYRNTEKTETRFLSFPEVGDKTPCRQTLGTEDGQSGWARASWHEQKHRG